MSDFEPGDKVRCVDANLNDLYDKYLEHDEIYTVSGVDGNLRLEEVTESVGADPKRFEKVEEPEFEVGDRVRLINFDADCEGKNWAEEDNLEKGETYEVRGFVENGFGQGNHAIRLRDQTYDHPADKFELISKGEDTMQKDVDAIAVEVDCEYLSEKVQEIAFENGYIQAGDFFEDDEIINPHNDVLAFNSKTSFIDKSGKSAWDDDQWLGKLSENWNKVVEFLEQESQPTPTLNGYEAEISSKGKPVENTTVKVGCWSDTWNRLQGFKGSAKDIGITEGTVTVSGEQIDIEEIYQFIEDIKELIES